nr:ComF family protein [Oceanococcus sp. HetDA_MAG_MS8]
MPRLGAACPDCAEEQPVVQSCARCLAKPPPWHSLRALAPYAPPFSQWMVQAKYYEDPVSLGMLRLLSAGLPYWRDYRVCPIPTPAARLRARGLNLAAALAWSLAKPRRLPLTEALGCDQTMPAQQGRSRQQRLQSRHKAFKAEACVAGQRILLVDDVMTTGSTLIAATQTLLRAGARRVDVVVWLRTPPPH